MWRGVVVCAALLFFLGGCSGPEDGVVAADFEAFFEQAVGADAVPIISSIAPGEGDGGNVYMHVAFDLVARKDVSFDAGWLTGFALEAGAGLSGGELVILYQKRVGDENWHPTWHELVRLPTRPE